MAHTIVAADLGGSHIKLARFEASFRKLVLLENGYDEEAFLRAFAPVLTDDAHCTKHFCIEDFEPRIELP